MRVAVDIGFGFVKVMTEHGRRKIFPTLIKNRVSTGLKAIIEAKQDDYAITYWEVESDSSKEKKNLRKCYVGDAAMTNGADRRWEDKNQFNADDLKILITTAVALVNPNNEDIDLSIGLPMSYFIEMKDKLEQALKSINSRIAISGISEERIVKVNSIFTFAQGAGAYWSGILDIDGNIKNYELAGKTVGVIDVGYRTVDYLIMKKGRKGINMIEELSGSFEDDGMNKVYNDIGLALQADGIGNIELTEIEKAILWFGSNLELLGEEINLIEYEKKAYKDRADSIASKIKKKWGKQEETISTVLITGGGGITLFEYFEDKFKQAKLQSNEDREDEEFASFANCAGYLGIQARKMKKST